MRDHPTILAVLAAVLLVGTGCTGRSQATPQDVPSAAAASPKRVAQTVVTLGAQGDGQETGVGVVLRLDDANTRITLHMDRAPQALPQAAYVAAGPCGDQSAAPAWRLTPVRTGVSSTDIAAPYASLLKDRTYSLRVRAYGDGTAVVSCGDIR